MYKIKLKQILLSVAALLIGNIAVAQVTTSSLTGTISDENGEPLVGAVVVATHIPSNTSYHAIANSDGLYSILGMRTGSPYTVEVSYIGMATVTYNDLSLKLGETYEIDVVMKSSSELNAATIIGEKPFNASITGAGSSFDINRIEKIPTIDRSVYDVVKYSPQANLAKNGGISFAGTNTRYNSFQIDGAIANDAFGLAGTGLNGGLAGSNPISMDALSEIQVVVAPYDVRQSGFTGGAINAVTKSGTNKVQGSFYTNFFNQNLMGTTPGSEQQMKDNWGTTERTRYSSQLYQTYGVTLGAPIIKDKLFIFVSGEYNKKSVPNVYTPANNTYANSPLNNEVFYNGQSLGNVFNSAMAEAVMKKYQETYSPKNFSESFTQHQLSDRFVNILARIDWNINDRNNFMFRYQYADGNADKYASSKSSYIFNNSSYLQSSKTHTVVAELNSRVSDNMSNELRATAVIVRDKRQTPYPGATIFIRDKVSMNIGTEYSSGANSVFTDTYTLTDNFSIFAGKHNITIGTHNQLFKFNNLFLQYPYGEYTFGTFNDFFNNNYRQYDYKYADPAYSGGSPIWAATAYALELGLYAQDEWKPNKNFSLTYGLRLDVPMLLNKPSVNDTFNKTSFAKDNGEYVGVTPKATPLFSPRIGFRWFLDDSHKSLLRGGAGIFTGRVPFVWFANAYNNTGVEVKSVTSKQAGLPLTSTPYEDIIKPGILSGTTSGSTINTLNEAFKYPQVFRADLGFDHEFASGWKISFDALFSKSLNSVYFKNLAISSKSSVYPVSAEATAANPVAKAPYYSITSSDYYAIVALGNTRKGYSYSLSGQVSKHFDFGLDLTAAYTFGHSYAVNDGLSSIAYSCWKNNYSVDTNSPDELSYSIFDKPHKVSAVASYTTPAYGNGRFRTNITLAYQGGSGLRYSYTMNESTKYVDFNGDGQYGNSLLYVPTAAELPQMRWADQTSAEKFEKFIQNDRYLNSRRGNWSERNAGIAPFENHFDLQISEDFYYDSSRSRKIQIMANLINIGNLLNRSWGMYYTPVTNRMILQVESMEKDAMGNATPTYSFNEKNSIGLDNFNSRWRCQLTLRVTF